MLAITCLTGCGKDDASDAPTGGKSAQPPPPKAGEGTGGSAPIVPVTPTGTSSAADLARKLGRDANFLIGMGNDLPANFIWENSVIYTLGAQLDVHYIYLAQGWQDWNAGGMFPKIIAEVDLSKGATPMSTVYAMAGKGENNLSVLVDDAYMTAYWNAAKVLMQRYAELDTPTIVHLEPDFWAFAQHLGNDPSKLPSRLHPDCTGLPADISGMARCWFKLARDNAPKVLIGLHASEWAAGSGNDVGAYLNALGAAESDLVFIDMLDRDAGCFEEGKLPQCMRGAGPFYLDETNETSPNYAERLAFAKQVHDTTEKPILWWQLPFGVPSDTPGGTPGHFRDNKVHYIFSHIQEFVDAGGVGAAFGTGAGDQTYPGTDGGQFDDAVQAYYANPVALP